MLKSLLCLCTCQRNSSFFNRTAHEIWKSTVSVSNPGAKKGRGRRGAFRIKNLNIGQEIGVGQLKVYLPGMNAPLAYADRPVKIKEEGVNEEYERRLSEIRSRFMKPKRQIISPSERGWSGGHIGGRSIGQLEPVDGYHADLFDTRVLHYSQKMIMTRTFGKRRRVRVVVACGNKQGLVGLGAFSGVNVKTSLEKAKQRAGRNLVYVPFDNDGTVLHNFISEFGYARLYVVRKGEGNGLICHRLLRSMCELIGIRNLYAKSDGSPNPVSIANAFLLGLTQQKSYQQWADEQKLLVVSIDSRAGGLPVILASPSDGQVRSEIREDEDVDFNRLCLRGLTRYDQPWKSSRIPWYFRTKGYTETYLKHRIRPLVQYRDSVVERLATNDQYDESLWKYPRFDPSVENEK